jgi:hypothetical protein
MIYIFFIRVKIFFYRYDNVNEYLSEEEIVWIPTNLVSDEDEDINE